MPSLFAVRRLKVLPTVFLFLLFSIHTIAAPFTPVIGRPIPKLNGGLNLYPPYQEDIEDYGFNDEDKNFDRDFHGPSRDKRPPQYRLMNKIHSGFIDEFQRAPKMDGRSNEQPNTGGDSFQRSSSNNVGGWGKVRATPAGRGRSPKVARITRKDGHHPNPTISGITKRDIQPGTLQPEKICDFLQLPSSCSNELTLPSGLPDIPIISIEIEHSELSWFITEDFEAADPTSTDKSSELHPSRKTLQGSMQENQPEDGLPPSAFEYPLDSSVPVFLKIGFLPDAAAALGVNQAVTGTMDMPISEFLEGIPYTYTETYFQYHEVETICLTREIGPFVVCERVYGGNSDDDLSPKKVTEEPVVPSPDAEDPAVYVPSAEDIVVYSHDTEDTVVYVPSAEDTVVYVPDTEDTVVYVPDARDTAVFAANAEVAENAAITVPDLPELKPGVEVVVEVVI